MDQIKNDFVSDNHVISTSQSRIDVLQFLRFFAAMMVVINHLPTVHPSEHIYAAGVDIFFVISGFIMAYTTERRADNFMQKRIIRIVPIYWLFTICIFFVALVAPNLLNTSVADPVQLVKSIFFIPYIKNEHGYFPMLFVGWSLNYEMFFYVVFAISLVISQRFRLVITSAFLVFIVVATDGFRAAGFHSEILEFYSDGIIIEFIMGMLIYKFSKDENYLNPENLFLIFLIVIGVALSFMENPEHRLVQRGVPAMLLVFVGLTFCARIPINKYLVRFGDASYSLYLLHMFVIKVADKKLKLFDGDNVFLLILFSVATVIVCVIASEISYKLIEVSSARYLKRKFRI